MSLSEMMLPHNSCSLASFLKSSGFAKLGIEAWGDDSHAQMCWRASLQASSPLLLLGAFPAQSSRAGGAEGWVLPGIPAAGAAGDEFPIR